MEMARPQLVVVVPVRYRIFMLSVHREAVVLAIILELVVARDLPAQEVLQSHRPRRRLIHVWTG